MARLRINLGTRIFLVTALLIVLSVGSAVVITTIRGEEIARQAVASKLEKSHTVQSTFLTQRFEQIRLMGQIFAADPEINAYLAEAAEDRDIPSILDQLLQRQQDLGYDFAILLDYDGIAVVHTERLEQEAEDYSESALVAQALDEGTAYGIWREEEQLYAAAVVPLVKNFDLFGFLVFGFAFDDAAARDVARLGSTEVTYLVTGAAGASVVATTLDRQVAEDVLLNLRSQGALSDILARRDQIELDLDGRAWIALISPLLDPYDEQVGATLALAPLDRELASYRQIERLLLGVGGLSVVVALLLSFALSFFTMRPIRQLVTASESARRGRYDDKIRIKRRDEVGRLATAFNGLLSELREKQDMETYIASLSRSLPEPASQTPSFVPAHSVDTALMALELRHLANPRLTKDPERSLQRLNQELRRAQAAILGSRGKIESLCGHRLLASFEGDEGAYRALSVATELVKQFGEAESSFEEPQPPAVAISSGETLQGSVPLSNASNRAVAGLPVQQLESLLREATPGDILLTKQAHDRLGEAFARAGLELSAQRGLMSTQPLYLINVDIAARVTTGPVPLPSPTRPAVDEGAPTLSQIGPGATLGDRYEILSVLGAGGMGIVYKARDRELSDLVALKMLKQDVWNNPVELERLKNELKLARRITHPNVLRTYDFGEFDGVPFISMEYVRGLTLRYMLDETGRLPFAAALRLAKQLCLGLGAAHKEGVIHRDIKPENLILEPNGNAKLMDFGIAQPVRKIAGQVTGDGMILGTPHYLAPEQLEGREPDTRADIYACGMVIYEMFTGKLPFSGTTPMEIVQQHLNTAPRPPSEYWSSMPKALEALILRCLEKKPEGRWPNVTDLGRALAHLER